jgi:arylsulfatase A-like enzyme
MPEVLKPVLARQMEVYAGFLEHTDHHVGRLIDALADLEVLDDTLVYYIIGDNGASTEGTLNEMISLNGAAALETPEFLAARIDQFATPQAYNHFAVGWAHAMDTPISGPSRWPPTGAGPATAPSSTGPTASRPVASCGPSSTT